MVAAPVRNSYRVAIVSVSARSSAAHPLPVTERGRRSRAAIIDAAATLMYQRGVGLTTLDDVLAAAGAGKSQLYHYFDSKADLVAAVIERQLEMVLAQQPRWSTSTRGMGSMVGSKAFWLYTARREARLPVPWAQWPQN